MKYYILYPDQQKDSIDYNRQLAVDSGVNIAYLKPAFRDLIQGLSVLGVGGFTEELCDPNEIVIFSEKGEEWNLETFTDMLYNKYKSVKHDY